MTSENIISASFEEPNEAYGAFMYVRELDQQRLLELRGGAILDRSEDGQIVTRDSVGDGPDGAAKGGVLGLLVGVLVGPFGMLIGAATGALIGSRHDARDQDETESALAGMSSTIQSGRTTVLLDVVEQNEQILDDAVTRFHGSVERRLRDDVEMELARSEDAHRAAKHEGDRTLRAQGRASG